MLPFSQAYHEGIIAEKGKAFKGIGWMKNFANPDIESAAISHFIVNYEVTPPHFHKVTYDLINENVEFMAKAYTNQLTAIECIRLLNNYGGRNAFYNSAALIYEDFVADLLARRFP